jgi:hypothetical protein
MRLCCCRDGIGFLFVGDGGGGGDGDGGVDRCFHGGFALFHEFVVPVPTNAIFDPVNVVGD